MNAPIKFLSWVLGVVFILGIGDSFVNLTYRMGQAAIHAHKHDQISYSKYTRLLWQDNTAKVKKAKTQKSR
ncbi:MAG: hypothetical protein HUU56_17665 [Bdellovibrionaceae bacterium]|nr:hypothetical protein [Pseudobdellovibrionaceae bacterium]